MSRLPELGMWGCCLMRKDHPQTRLAERRWWHALRSTEGAVTRWRRHRKEEPAIAFSPCASVSVPAGKQRSGFCWVFATVGSSGPVDILILRKKKKRIQRTEVTGWPTFQSTWREVSYTFFFFFSSPTYRTSFVLEMKTIAAGPAGVYRPEETSVALFFFLVLKYFLLRCLYWNLPGAEEHSSLKEILRRPVLTSRSSSYPCFAFSFFIYLLFMAQLTAEFVFTFTPVLHSEVAGNPSWKMYFYLSHVLLV